MHFLELNKIKFIIFKNKFYVIYELKKKFA